VKEAEAHMKKENLLVSWVDRGFEPTCEPDPRFPNGVDLDLTTGQVRTCQTALPYPARRCGYFVVNCSACGLQAVVTTAGRRDDPRSIKVACKSNASNHDDVQDAAQGER
jgi:hypothetical protein